MSEEDEGTITPEVELKESQERLSEEQERLLKLYAAYEIQEKEYKEVELKHMLADNCAMQLVREPKQFDVIVTCDYFVTIVICAKGDYIYFDTLVPSPMLGANFGLGNGDPASDGGL